MYTRSALSEFFINIDLGIMNTAPPGSSWNHSLLATQRARHSVEQMFGDRRRTSRRGLKVSHNATLKVYNRWSSSTSHHAIVPTQEKQTPSERREEPTWLTLR